MMMSSTQPITFCLARGVVISWYPTIWLQLLYQESFMCSSELEKRLAQVASSVVEKNDTGILLVLAALVSRYIPERLMNLRSIV
jgi:hypothetical protein